MENATIEKGVEKAFNNSRHNARSEFKKLEEEIRELKEMLVNKLKLPN